MRYMYWSSLEYIHIITGHVLMHNHQFMSHFSCNYSITQSHIIDFQK
jgi:hypothetical protein